MRKMSTLTCLVAILAWSPMAGADTGGPDKGGYQLLDNGEEGVIYEWLDVSAEGAEIALSDDQQSAAVDLGFSFTFYGETFDQVRVGSNGFLSFQSNDLSGGFAGQCPLPMPGQPDLAVYGFYQDLDPTEDTSGPIYVDTMGMEPERRFVATWDGVEIFLQEGWESDPVTFQIILYEGSNEIQVNIMNPGVLAGMPVWSDNATIGIEGPEGAAGLGLCPGLIPSEYSVRFSASDDWGLFPTEGALTAAAGDEATFDLELVNFAGTNLDVTIAAESGAGWTVSTEPAAATILAGGAALPFQVKVTPPAGAALGAADTITVTVTGGGEDRVATLDVTAASPSDAWQDLAPLPQAIRFAALVSDGDALYSIGGMRLDTETEQWEPLDKVLRWTPDGNTWEENAAENLPVPAAGGRACFMDGKIYYAGGYDGAAEDDVHWSFQEDLLIYDIAMDSWDTAGPIPVAVAQAAVVCFGAKVYVVNGLQDLDDNGALVTAADAGADGTAPRLQIYDAAGGAWAAEGAAPPSAATAAAAAIIDGTLILAGGYFDNPDDPSASLVTRATLRYDLAGDSWDEDGPFLSDYRSDMGAAMFQNTLCVIGGVGVEGALESWECLGAEAWVTQVDTLPVARYGMGAAGMDGFVYVAGGQEGDALLDTAARWPTGDLGEPGQPEPSEDTGGGEPDVVTGEDTLEPGEDTLLPGDDTTILPGEDTDPGGGDAALGDTNGGGETGGGGGGGGCSTGPGSTSSLLLLLLLGLALRLRRTRPSLSQG